MGVVSMTSDDKKMVHDLYEKYGDSPEFYDKQMEYIVNQYKHRLETMERLARLAEDKAVCIQRLAEDGA